VNANQSIQCGSKKSTTRGPPKSGGGRDGGQEKNFATVTLKRRSVRRTRLGLEERIEGKRRVKSKVVVGIGDAE